MKATLVPYTQGGNEVVVSMPAREATALLTELARLGGHDASGVMGAAYPHFDRLCQALGSVGITPGDRRDETHKRIAALPRERQGEAMRRASRSYSAPDTCLRHDGCTREGDDIVWPDGERGPARA